jgi:6-phosphogluconolactonase
MDRTVCPSAEEAAEACAKHLVTLLQSAGNASLAVSGGSTPKLLFDRLSARSVAWDRVHLFWVDERGVPPDHPDSNYRLAEKHLIVPAGIHPENVHRVLAEIPAEQAAERYTEEIQEFFRLQAGSMPEFDVIHLGMGPDAHTASLFPGQPMIDDRQNIAAAVYVEKFSQWRITLLPGVVLAAKQVVMLVAGADKAEAVKAVFTASLDAKRYPAQIVHQAKRVHWFMDRAATRLLD